MENQRTIQIHRQRHADTAGHERSLPLDWKYHRDLVLLLGEDLEEFARRLLAQGQERLILQLAPGQTAPDLPAPAIVVTSDREVQDAIISFPEPLPSHVKVSAGKRSWPTEDALKELMVQLESCLTSKRVYHNTVEHLAPLIIQQGLNNLHHIASYPSMHGLENKFAGKPCILVAPGPSLSKNLALLKEFKGRALIMTGSHTLGAFKSAGVHPDFVLAVDAGDMRSHYEDYDLSGIEALVVAITCSDDHFALPARRTFTLMSNRQSDSWFFEALDEETDMVPGGSVACTAFSLARFLGCSPLILVGQDLSFPGNKYYADECVHGEVEVQENDDGSFFLRAESELLENMSDLEDGGLRFTRNVQTTEVPGYHGGMVRTSEVLRTFLWWFESVISSIDDTPTVWNCTEGGARIAGTRQLPLAQALKELEHASVDPAGVLDAALARHDIHDRRDRLIMHFEHAQNELILSRELARRCKQATPEAARDAWGLAKLELLENRLTETVRQIRCLSLVTQSEITAAIEEARDAPDLARNLAASNCLYDVVERGSEFLLEPLAAGLEGLRRIA